MYYVTAILVVKTISIYYLSFLSQESGLGLTGSCAQDLTGMKCQPALQSHLRFGVSYEAIVGQIQLLVVVGLKFHFLAGVS